MGLIDKLKAHIEVWKIEKYTKRRDVATPDFERKGKPYNIQRLLPLQSFIVINLRFVDADYYRDHYQNGVYLSEGVERNTRSNSSIGRRTTLIRKKSERIVRCSEVYNTTQ